MPKRANDRRTVRAPSDGGNAAERRLHERVLVNLEVDYRADDTFLFAYITDISVMGIFVHTDAPEPEGTRLNLCFHTPPELGGELVEMEGEVIWINPLRPHDPSGRNPGMGVKFVDMTPLQRDVLLRIVHTFAYLDEDEEEDDDGAPLGSS